MLITKQLIKKVSRHLNDQELDYEYARWSEQDLMQYLKLALNTIYYANKELFVKEKTFDLKKGSLQEIPDKYEIIDVLYIKDKQGNISHLRKTYEGYSFIKPFCTSNNINSFRFDSWSFIDGFKRNKFLVYPPVPADNEYQAVINVFYVDDITDEMDINSDLESVIFEFMLYYAYSSEQDNQLYHGLADKHYTHAFDLLSLYVKSELAKKNKVRRR